MSLKSVYKYKIFHDILIFTSKNSTCCDSSHSTIYMLLNKYLITIFAQHNICVYVSFVRQFVYLFVHRDKLNMRFYRGKSAEMKTSSCSTFRHASDQVSTRSHPTISLFKSARSRNSYLLIIYTSCLQ